MEPFAEAMKIVAEVSVPAPPRIRPTIGLNARLNTRSAAPWWNIYTSWQEGDQLQDHISHTVSITDVFNSQGDWLSDDRFLLEAEYQHGAQSSVPARVSITGS
jgi:hypothetical protein